MSERQTAEKGAGRTIPHEAFDVTHPDHEWYVEQTNRCWAIVCESHGKTGAEPCGVRCPGDCGWRAGDPCDPCVIPPGGDPS